LLLYACTAAAASASKLPFSCPRDLVRPISDTPAVVARAALRLVPVEYHALRSQRAPGWPQARVVGVVSTDGRFYAPQPPLRALAVRLCGKSVADASWAIFFQFPECQLPCSEDTALAADTRRGWRIWYSEFRRP
jgi:hypothetical protein